MFNRIHSAVCFGIEGRDVFVETDIARGLPGISIVGLASTMVMESRERIKSAVINSGLEFPRGKITVNLTPASLRKNGSCLDLPIAVGILASDNYVNPDKLWSYGILGELALDGRVLGVSGVLPMMLCMCRAGIRNVIVPAENRSEAALVKGINIYPVSELRECLDLVNGLITPEELIEKNSSGSMMNGVSVRNSEQMQLDYRDISGQDNAKRAVTIAVTGRHGLLMIGSPGCGKTMIASRIPTVMPPMTEEEQIETAVIYSAAGKNSQEDIVSTVRPFRHPHHTIGRAGLLGGGIIPVPGEISLAHNGVLFLDEICEFDRENVEALRLPLEEKRIVHFRRGEGYIFPCNFQLVMAANPCPCGFFGDPGRICKCTEVQLDRYRKKLSGPIMDRIDMRIAMQKVEFDELRSPDRGMSSEDIRIMVKTGIEFAGVSGRKGYNSGLADREIDRWCSLGREEEAFMNRAYDALKMTPRSYKKTLKVARTIADLDQSDVIRIPHLSEALSYRIIERIND